MHEALQSLDFLVGTWVGAGHGVYPTIESFDYDEEITIAPLGPKPMLRYSQLTWKPDTREPMHSEVGYLRPVGADAAELVIAQPTGVTEIHAGTIDGTRIEFRTVSVGLAPTAKEVSTVERRIGVTGDRLTYELWMGAVGQPHQIHLEATLERQLGSVT
jgi:hypothetical protein